MRGCAASFLVLLLLAVNGYALWQVVRLRAEVAELRAAVTALGGRQPESNVDLAEAALKAVQRGQWDRARALLETLSDRIEKTETFAGRQGQEVQRRLAEARTALDQKRQDAAAAVQALRDGLSRHKRNGPGRREDARGMGNCSLGQGV